MEGLCNLDFHIPRSGKEMARQVVIFNRMEEELPSASDVARVENVVRIM